MSHQPAAPVDFRRLFGLVRELEGLAAERSRIRSRIAGAWAELCRPGCNASLALAHLDRLRARQSALGSRLRAARVEGQALLGAIDRGPGSEPASWPEPSPN